jgi:hypothetical protein
MDAHSVLSTMLQRTYNTWRERKFVQNAIWAVEPEGTMGDENDAKMNMDVETMSTPAAISLRR